jgi:NAD(P)-dependent dehydrogenase (short-subunit alcohol dehydrogenase family)
MTKPVCVISGVGPGTGSALARRFEHGGYRVAMLARNTLYLARRLTPAMISAGKELGLSVLQNLAIVVDDPVPRCARPAIAREFGPRNIHVGHVVIDGGIDGDRFNSVRPGVKEKRGADGLLNIEAIAEAYWTLHHQHRSAWTLENQHRSAWTLELDVRPWSERF